MKYLDLVVIVIDTSNYQPMIDDASSYTQVGIQVKNDQIEILDQDRARVIFEDYDRAYGCNQCDGPIQTSQAWGYQGNSCFYLDNILGVKPGLSKNDPGYYGVPDYTFQTGIVTVKDLERFADKWLEEKQAEEVSDFGLLFI